MSGVSRATLCRHYARSTLATQREHHSGVPVHLVPTSSVGAVGASAVAVIAALCRQAALPSDLLRDNEILVPRKRSGPDFSEYYNYNSVRTNIIYDMPQKLIEASAVLNRC